MPRISTEIRSAIATTFNELIRSDLLGGIVHELHDGLSTRFGLIGPLPEGAQVLLELVHATVGDGEGWQVAWHVRFPWCGLLF